MMDILDFDANAKTINNLTFTDYYYRLKNLALSMFEYENLPEGMKPEYIEKPLYSEGFCMLYKDDTIGYAALKCLKEGINEFGEPIDLIPSSSSGLVEAKPYRNGVEAIFVKNNKTEVPTDFTIKMFAFRLAELTRTIDINVEAQKTPILITCSDKTKNSLKVVYKNYQGKEPVIYVDKSLNTGECLQVFKTDAPIVFDKLQLQKHAIWNEAMTFLGIQNANQDKKERLVDDEVQANNEQVELSGDVFLQSRQEAVEAFNELFCTKIKVKRRKLEIDPIEEDSEGSEEFERGE